MTAVFIYAFCNSQEIIQKNIESVLIWSKLEYIGIPYITTFILIISIHLRFGDADKPLSAAFYSLFLIPAVIMLCQWSYPVSSLFYRDFSAVFNENGFILSISPGPVYYLHIAHTIAGMVLSLVFFTGSLFKTSRKNRMPVYCMIFGMLIPSAAFILYNLSVFPNGLDPIPIALALVGPFFTAGLFPDRMIRELSSATRKFFENTFDPVLIFDKGNHLIDFNEPAAYVFKLNMGEKGKKSTRKLTVEDIFKGNSLINFELNEGGNIFRILSFPFDDIRGRQRGTIFMLNDITGITQAMEILENQAAVDGLTGLYNRKKWEELTSLNLRHSIRYNHPGSILMLDLDYFKSINDTYGHQGGDIVLKTAAGLMAEALREVDIQGRYGGDEFCVWLTETPPERAVVIAERIRSRIADVPVRFGKENISVTVSIGVYGMDSVGDIEVGEYIEKADKALYKAKENGRNCVYIGKLRNTPTETVL